MQFNKPSKDYNNNYYEYHREEEWTQVVCFIKSMSSFVQSGFVGRNTYRNAN